MNKWVTIILLPLIFWGIARFCHRETAGFRLSKLVNNTTPFLEHQTLPPEIQTLLNQKFTYLGRGLQSFAFVSEDGKYVLKLFNNRYQNRLFWLRYLPFSKEKIQYYSHKLAKTFTSYQLAFDTFKEETGLIYLKTGSSQSVSTVIEDRLHICHKLDLKQTAFLLQKRATLVYDYLSDLEREGKHTLAVQAIQDLVGLFKLKLQKGIEDSDSLIRTNFGFAEGKPLQIDVGTLSQRAPLSQEEQALQLQRITLSLKHWLEKNHPDLKKELENALAS